MKQNPGQRSQSSTVNMPVLLPPERLLNRKNSKEWTPEEAEFYFDWLIVKKDIRVSDLLAHLKMEMAPMGEQTLISQDHRRLSFPDVAVDTLCYFQSGSLDPFWGGTVVGSGDEEVA